jgi:hypothetical protein
LKSLTADLPPLFTELKPSTLTAQGRMTNIYFNESEIIDTLSVPTGDILKIGCNYGEKYNPDHVNFDKRTALRGRKPKPKEKSRRKVQGSGLYFSSQISFVIRHPDNHTHRYIIKLFRNGVFQVPGLREPSMHDLIKPIEILRQYLEYNFAESVSVVDFTAVMRNYKSSLCNAFYRVHLERLEEIILKEKCNIKLYNVFFDYMLRDYKPKAKARIKSMLTNYNPMSIAEMTYNTDRCFSLIIKFYRPSALDPTKKATVKLLKKGKINFDGGNSQQEVDELYYWLQYIYHKYKDEILFDEREIKNETDQDTSDGGESVYDADT